MWTEKPHPPGSPRIPRKVCSAHHPGPGPSWALQATLAPQLRDALPLRSEEVNWTAWEQTLPTVSEEPAGPGNPGE